MCVSTWRKRGRVEVKKKKQLQGLHFENFQKKRLRGREERDTKPTISPSHKKLKII